MSGFRKVNHMTPNPTLQMTWVLSVTKSEAQSVIITNHALARFRSRTKTTKPDAAVQSRIRDRLEGAVKISPERYYSRGFVWVICGNILVTVMKPTTRNVQAAVYRAVTGIPVTGKGSNS